MEDYTISPVTSPDDVFPAATAFMKAARESDTFWEMQARYGRAPPFESLLKVAKAAVEDPNQHVFQVVHNPSGEVVGMAQWKAPCLLEVEKDVEAAVAPLPLVEKDPEDSTQAAGVAMVEEARRQIWKAYTENVRGERHVCEWKSPCAGQMLILCQSSAVWESSRNIRGRELLRVSCNGVQIMLTPKDFFRG